MAIYHYSAQMIKRSAGRSAIAAAAYRAGECIEDKRTGLTHDYTRKSGIEYTEIMAPEKVPDWVYNRADLWNHVEEVEKRCDSQTAREINVALPIELNIDQNKELLRGYIKDNFVSRGMIADLAIHYNDSNPHAHIMLTTREITPEGFGLKNREWNPEFANKYNKSFVKNSDNYVDWRAGWQEHANHALELAGCTERIDHRSLQEQGIDRLPTIHEGPHVRAMEEQGIETIKGNYNRSIQDNNQKLEDIKRQEIVNLVEYREVKKLYENEIEGWKYYNSRERGAVERAHEILGDKPVAMDNLEQKLKNLSNEKMRAADPGEKQLIMDQEKDIRKAFAALRSVELKEFAANTTWEAGSYVDYNELQAIKKILNTDVFDPEQLPTEHALIMEQIDETRQTLSACREGIISLQNGQRAYTEYVNLQSRIMELEKPGKKLRGLVDRTGREERQHELDQLKNQVISLQNSMDKSGVTDKGSYDQTIERIEILKNEEISLHDNLATYMDRQVSLNRALQSVNSGNVRQKLTTDLSRTMEGQKAFSDTDSLYLGERVTAISSEIGFRDRYTNIRYLSGPLQGELRELADWVLARPEFKETVDQYLDTQRGLIENQYKNTARTSAVDKIISKAYESLRDRVAQELKNQAVTLLKDDNGQKEPSEFKNAPGLSGGREPDPEKEAQEWFRKTFRDVEREKAITINQKLTLAFVPDIDTEPLINTLHELADKLPDNLAGKAVIAYLPKETKAAAWAAADQILQQPELNINVADPDYEALRKNAAETAVYHAMRLIPREMPDIKMVVHDERAADALEKIKQADGHLMKDSPDESLWTGKKLVEALRTLGSEQNDAIDVLTKWGTAANLSESQVNNLVNRYQDTSKKDTIIWRGQWNRLADNLGYKEKDFLYPWMGVMQDNSEIIKEIKPVDTMPKAEIIQENIPAILQAFEMADENPEDIREIKWTFSTGSRVLHEMGIDAGESFEILNNWATRSNIEISEARIKDIVDRATLNDKSRWLGDENWERLFMNMGIYPPPSKLWQLDHNNKQVPNLNKEAQEWFRKTFRDVEREVISLSGNKAYLADLPEIKEVDKGDLEHTLQKLATKLPADLGGKAVLAYLPEESKIAVKEAVDRIFRQPDIMAAVNNLNYETIKQLQDNTSETAILHASRLMVQDKEMPEIKMLVHPERASNALERIKKADGSIIKDSMERRWTSIKLAQTLRIMGCEQNDAIDLLTKWGTAANLSEKQINILGKVYENTDDKDTIIWRGQWNRLADNLGYKEKDFLYPWMGEVKKPAEEIKKPIPAPEIRQEAVPFILQAFNQAAGRPTDLEEIKWTLWTSAWVLKEMGVSTKESYAIINNWAIRANIEISEVRIMDIVDRAAMNDTSKWLGRDNWERLFSNLGVEVPPIPWLMGGINWGSIAIKATYRAVEQEKVKAEIQGRKFAAWVKRQAMEQERKGQDRSR